MASIDSIHFAPVSPQKSTIAQQIDLSRNALSALMNSSYNMTGKQLSPRGQSGDLQAMIDIGCGFVKTQRLEVVTRRNSLI